MDDLDIVSDVSLTNSNAPFRLSINGSSSDRFPTQVPNFSRTPTLYISLVEVDTDRAVALEDMELELVSRSLKLQDVSEGITELIPCHQWLIPSMHIRAENAGRHLITISGIHAATGDPMVDVQPAVVEVYISLNNHPRQIRLISPTSSILTVGTVIKPAIHIVGDCDKFWGDCPPGALTCELLTPPMDPPVKLPLFVGTSTMQASDAATTDKVPTYTFPGLATFPLTVADVYKLVIRLDLRSLAYACMIDPAEGVLEQSYIFTLKNLEPRFLAFESSEPSIRTKLYASKEDPFRKLFSTITIALKDAHSNTCSNMNDGTVKAMVQRCDTNSLSRGPVPVLEGPMPVEVRIVKGRARFKSMKIKEKSRALSGSYQICFLYGHLEAITIRFEYVEDARTLRSLLPTRPSRRSASQDSREGPRVPAKKVKSHVEDARGREESIWIKKEREKFQRGREDRNRAAGTAQKRSASQPLPQSQAKGAWIQNSASPRDDDEPAPDSSRRAGVHAASPPVRGRDLKPKGPATNNQPMPIDNSGVDQPQLGPRRSSLPVTKNPLEGLDKSLERAPGWANASKSLTQQSFHDSSLDQIQYQSHNPYYKSLSPQHPQTVHTNAMPLGVPNTHSEATVSMPVNGKKLEDSPPQIQLLDPGEPLHHSHDHSPHGAADPTKPVPEDAHASRHLKPDSHSPAKSKSLSEDTCVDRKLEWQEEQPQHPWLSDGPHTFEREGDVMDGVADDFEIEKRKSGSRQPPDRKSPAPMPPPPDIIVPVTPPHAPRPEPDRPAKHRRDSNGDQKRSSDEAKRKGPPKTGPGSLPVAKEQVPIHQKKLAVENWLGTITGLDESLEAAAPPLSDSPARPPNLSPAASKTVNQPPSHQPKRATNNKTPLQGTPQAQVPRHPHTTSQVPPLSTSGVSLEQRSFSSLSLHAPSSRQAPPRRSPSPPVPQADLPTLVNLSGVGTTRRSPSPPVPQSELPILVANSGRSALSQTQAEAWYRDSVGEKGDYGGEKAIEMEIHFGGFDERVRDPDLPDDETPTHEPSTVPNARHQGRGLTIPHRAPCLQGRVPDTTLTLRANPEAVLDETSDPQKTTDGHGTMDIHPVTGSPRGAIDVPTITHQKPSPDSSQANDLDRSGASLPKDDPQAIHTSTHTHTPNKAPEHPSDDASFIEDTSPSKVYENKNSVSPSTSLKCDPTPQTTSAPSTTSNPISLPFHGSPPRKSLPPSMKPLNAPVVPQPSPDVLIGPQSPIKSNSNLTDDHPPPPEQTPPRETHPRSPSGKPRPSPLQGPSPQKSHTSSSEFHLSPGKSHAVPQESQASPTQPLIGGTTVLATKPTEIEVQETLPVDVGELQRLVKQYQSRDAMLQDVVNGLTKERGHYKELLGALEQENSELQDKVTLIEGQNMTIRAQALDHEKWASGQQASLGEQVSLLQQQVYNAQQERNYADQQRELILQSSRLQSMTLDKVRSELQMMVEDHSQLHLPAEDQLEGLAEETLAEIESKVAKYLTKIQQVQQERAEGVALI